MNSLPPARELHPLTVEEIEQVAVGFKDDLTRECERLVRRNDNTGALAAIHGKEYIDKFVYALKLRAGSDFGRVREPKKRIRRIYIPEIVSGKKPPVRVPLSPEAAADLRHVREVVAASGERRVPKHY